MVRILSAVAKSLAARASLACWMKGALGSGAASGWEKSCAGRAGARIAQ